jgi:hypothetical protein
MQTTQLTIVVLSFLSVITDGSQATSSESMEYTTFEIFVGKGSKAIFLAFRNTVKFSNIVLLHIFVNKYLTAT